MRDTTTFYKCDGPHCEVIHYGNAPHWLTLNWEDEPDLSRNHFHSSKCVENFITSGGALAGEPVKEEQ